ncbi:MAG TPA: hypothetical protein DEQ09_00115 [Bacteroidales bacterium]|mgnify:CR=1 FL=1|nr:hypothetical protein [Bacteroidales bacterium]
MRKYLIIHSLSLTLAIMLQPLNAQDIPESKDSLRSNAVRVFIDCRRCDMDYIRKEIPYINYVRDVKEAQVYILQTQLSTGSGGREYTFTYIGQEEYEGMNDTLVYHSTPDDTRNETRRGTTKILSMGLMRYVARTPLFEEVEINHLGTSELNEVIDKWDYWVFELELDPEFELEESLKSINLENSINVSRITDAMKYELNADMNFSKTKYDYDDTTYVRDRNSWRIDNLLVFSLSQHWSAGFRTDLTSSTYRNLKSSFDLVPSVEYNIFPYSESTRKQLRMLYGIGYSYNNYIDTTIYNKTQEHLLEQTLDIAYRIQQKWGSINISLEASSFLHDFSKNMIELDGYVSIRIVKGLSFNLRGSVAKINNQITIPKGDLDEADILLELQELQTAYSIDGGFGLTYTFGSIYNNVVNPRFGSGRYR